MEPLSVIAIATLAFISRIAAETEIAKFVE
ncbi:hypothetical protein Xen7305DRAFT_00042410 [Xenococcus sp. PCC 7305]|nr:hypothetical protein Xen7305DRAFT_00042410 [Xenococcus sp. PCC 7305]